MSDFVSRTPLEQSEEQLSASIRFLRSVESGSERRMKDCISQYPLLDSLQEKLIAAEKAFKEADEKLNSNNAFEPIGKIDETNEAAYAEWKER